MGANDFEGFEVAPLFFTNEGIILYFNDRWRNVRTKFPLNFQSFVQTRRRVEVERAQLFEPEV